MHLRTIFISPPVFKKLRSQRGSSVAEMALIIPILVYMLFAIVEFSFYMSLRNAHAQLVREAARYAAVHGMESTFDSSSSTSASLRYFINKEFKPNSMWYAATDYPSIADADVVVQQFNPTDGTYTTTTSTSTRTPGYGITVSITMDYSKKIGLKALIPGLSSLATKKSMATTFVLENPSN